MATNRCQQIVQKLWSYCTVPRVAGFSYGHFVEHVMHDERGKRGKTSAVLWNDLTTVIRRLNGVLAG